MSKYNIHNLKVGDEVIVNEEMRNWTMIEGWGTEGNELIGKTLTIKSIVTQDYRNTNIVHFHETTWWVPMQCLDPIEKDETISIK